MCSYSSLYTGIEFKGQKRPEEIPKAKNLVDNFARLGFMAMKPSSMVV